MRNYKTELKWAVIFVLFTLLWMAMEKIAGLHDRNIAQHATVSGLFFIPAIAIYVFALLDKRKNDYGGAMNFKQGFFAGLVITVVVTVFSPITQSITSLVISPDFFENMIQHSVDTGNLSQSQAEAQFNFKNYLILSAIYSFIYGVITSALVALFVRKRPSEKQEPFPM